MPLFNKKIFCRTTVLYHCDCQNIIEFNVDKSDNSHRLFASCNNIHTDLGVTCIWQSFRAVFGRTFQRH